MFLFFKGPSTCELYTLSLHDALPISNTIGIVSVAFFAAWAERIPPVAAIRATRSATSSAASASCCPNRCQDRKSTRLNSSHVSTSYAVFCLKKKKDNGRNTGADWLRK